MTSTPHGRGRGFRRAKLAAFLLPLALVLAACGGNDDNAGGSGGGAEPVGKITILLPFSRSIAFWPVHIAEEQGYFKDAGLDVTSEATDGSSFVVQQVAAGKSPVGIAVAEPVLLGYEQNANFSSVYEFLTGNVFDLWVPADSSVQKIGDLPKGSAIALKEQSGGEVPRLNAALEKAGLKPGSDIEYKYFGENASVAANLLAKGDAAAMMISWNSLVGVKQALEQQGKQLRCVTCSASDSLASESVIVSNKFLADHKDVVEKLGRAIAQGTVFGQTNPDAALALMKKVNPEEQVDAAYAKAYFEAAVEITKPRQPTNKFGWQDPAAYQRSMDLLLTPGNPSGLAGPVDLGKVINNDLVDAYNNFDKAAVETAAKEATG
jgi:ABC-type nitrate/sulfonate/bicarbonate transport system substrate-binding protein